MTKGKNRMRLLAFVAALTVVSSMSIAQFGYSNWMSGHAADAVDVSDAIDYIGEEAAKAAALTDAAVQESDVKYVDVWLEYNEGLPQHYTVKFESGQMKYKYEIDLYSGNVLEKRIENHGDQDADASKPESSEVDAVQYIGEEAAVAAALGEAGIQENDIKYVNVWLEYRDRVAQYYMVEFESNRVKYNYEIALCSGEVLEKWTETHGSQDAPETEIPENIPSETDSTSDTILKYIGEDAVKAVVLEDAGVQEGDVKYVSVWFAYDKGQPSCYVVKFGLRYEQDIRYKYEVDLYSGEILAKATEYYGDLNSDGDVSVFDAVMLQKYLLGSKSLAKEQYDAADINADGSVDVFDLVYLKRKIVSK